MNGCADEWVGLMVGPMVGFVVNELQSIAIFHVTHSSSVAAILVLNRKVKNVPFPTSNELNGP